MELIDLETEKKAKKRQKRKQLEANKAPDVFLDCHDGRYFKFAIDYTFKGRAWSFEMWAKSKTEAESRLCCIKTLPCEIKLIHSEIPV